MAATSTSPPKLTYNQRQGTAQFFNEPLGDDLALKMMLIPSGTFLMGSPADELERREREDPQHKVRVSAFCLGKYPVTQAQWRVVAAMPPVNRELKPDPSNFKGDKRPVEQVPWFDAVEFCDRLSVHTGRKYRLPSEAEWEYACRASPIFVVATSKVGDAAGGGANTPFHFGETITTEVANYRGNGERYGAYGRGPKGEYHQETTPVDHFAIANAFGLCDMHGNVWEWCQDHWHDSYEGAPTDESAWLDQEAGKETKRVLRGGSWIDYPRYCRSANRFFYNPRGTDDGIGFRVVCLAPRTLG
jgi:formylglycine-generating enzyme required for sulfatase activity